MAGQARKRSLAPSFGFWHKLLLSLKKKNLNKTFQSISSGLTSAFPSANINSRGLEWGQETVLCCRPVGTCPSPRSSTSEAPTASPGSLPGCALSMCPHSPAQELALLSDIHPGTVVSGQCQCQDPLLFPSHHRPLKHNKHPVWSGSWCPAELSLPASPACALDPAPQEKVRLPQTVVGLTSRGLHERTVLPGAQLATIESLPQEPPAPHPH